MRKKLWISLALAFVIPGLLFTVSCAKKAVMEPEVVVVVEEDDAGAMAAAEQAAAEEAARKAAMDARELFLYEDIYFEFDKSDLLAESQEVLRVKADFLKDNPDVLVIVEGHCDERGTNEYNLALGDRRASSAKAFLVNLGIAGSRLTSVSYGEERPADPGHDDEAWAKNRRAHFAID
ncbi:MAG: peptidoglycan-associated lipoprotein Pal [Desulfobacterales bacterium]